MHLHCLNLDLGPVTLQFRSWSHVHRTPLLSPPQKRSSARSFICFPPHSARDRAPATQARWVLGLGLELGELMLLVGDLSAAALGRLSRRCGARWGISFWEVWEVGLDSRLCPDQKVKLLKIE